MEIKHTHAQDAVMHDAHAHGHDHEHEHEDNFWTKYVFSTDHKMISKQFLITAIIMAFVAMGMSMIFRLQLAWPDTKFHFLESILGDWAKGGKLDPGFYLALVTIHGTIMRSEERRVGKECCR